jgi:sugar transferase (PEP-CTERM/EpsH1 system associated)
MIKISGTLPEVMSKEIDGIGSEMKTKLLHLIPSMNIGGREKVVIDLVEHTDKSEFKVEIACLGSEGTFYDRFKKLNVKLHFFRKEPGFDFLLFENLRRFLRKKKYEIVHCHNPGTLIYGALSAKLANIPKIVNTEHGYGTEISKRKILLETVLRNKIYATAAVSNDLKRKLVAHFLANPGKITVIHNGISSENDQQTTDKTAVKKSLGINPDDFVVGTVGRLEPVKDQKTLVEAFNILRQKISRTKLLIVGDGKERQNLQKTTDNLNLGNSIIFAGECNNVERLLQGMDAFVLPSLDEGISMTLLEAMREGVPVIASSVGGNVEVIEENRSGFLVPPGKPDIIAEKLLHLMVNKAMAESMRNNAMQRLLQHFNMNKCAEKYRSLYI